MNTRFLAVWGFKLLGGVSIALALYAALATHKWSHWKEIAGVLRIDLEEVRQLRAQDRANYENAQAAAQALAEAKKAKDAAQYQTIAGRSDNAEEASQRRAAANRYAAANRVRKQGPAASTGAASAASGAGEGSAAENADRSRPDSDVAIPRADFDALVENTIRLKQVHAWGEDLIAAGLATKAE